MRPVTPRGFRDVLPQEAAERESIARAIAATMASWGYGLVETPVAEEYATLEAGAGSSLEGTAFRLFDSDGKLLALRPEMTVPIARVAATRLAGEPGPYRLRYTADVFREQASMRGQARQFTQAGLEFLGSGGATRRRRGHRDLRRVPARHRPRGSSRWAWEPCQCCGLSSTLHRWTRSGGRRFSKRRTIGIW